MPKYRISFIVEQLMCQEVEATSKEEAYQIFCDSPSDPDLIDDRTHSYEVEEIEA